MASFLDCIKANTQSANGITAKQAEDLTFEYEDLVARYTDTLGDAGAAEKAAADIMRVKENVLRKKNDAVVRHALTQKKLFDELTAEKAEYEAYYNGLNKVAKKAHRKPSIAHNIANRLERVMSLQQGMARRKLLELYDFIEANRSKMAGLTQNTRDMPDVVRAVLGEKGSNDAANAFGDQVRKVFSDLNKQYDQAGGVIGRIENYYPQVHDGDLIVKAARKAGKDTADFYDDWAAEMLPRLDREKMIDAETALPITDKKLDQLMREDYEAITTNGLSEIQRRAKEGKQTFGFGSDTYQRRSSSRFYHFKSADDFLGYNEKFGHGNENLFDVITGHIDSMTRDIAMMHELGPKPKAMFNNFELMMQGDGVAASQQNFVKGMFDVLSGAIYQRGSLPLWYNILEGTKDVLRSAYLSLASVSAITDSGYVRLAAKMNGLPANKVTVRYAKLMKGGKEKEKLARTMYITGAINGKGFAAARYADDSMSRGVTRWMSNFTNRASGLQHMTDVGAMAPMAELSGMFADIKRTNKSWESLPADFRNMAKTFGIGKDEIEVMKKANYFNPDDQMKDAFIRPQEIAQIKTNAFEEITPEKATNKRISVFHQTGEEFDKFDLDKTADGTVWFSSDPKEFTRTGSAAAASTGNKFVIESDVYMNKVAGWDEIDKYSIDELISQGYDGAVLDGDVQVFNLDSIQSFKRNSSGDFKKSINKRGGVGKTQKELLDISYKFDTWMSRIGEMAVNEPTLRTRTITSGAFTGGDVRPATVSRAFWSSVFMFKSFPITVMQNFVLPLMRQSLQDPKGRGPLMAEMAIYTAMFGALAIQTKDILKGRDPRPMDNWKFVQASFLQGGGLGLFGDFIFSDQSRFGQTITQSAAGPVFGLANDLVKLTVGNAQKGLDPDADSDFVDDLIEMARRTIPVVKTPYTSIFVERLLYDSVEKMATGSDFRADTNRMKQRLRRDYNQGFWWEAGDLAPDRAPDIGNVTE